MRNSVCCLFLASAAALAQSTPDNAAVDALKKRMLSMNLLNPPARMPVVLAGPVAAPSKVCAIPLLRVDPPGTSDKMPAIKPSNKVLTGDTVQVPAPACGEFSFTNK
jgi:hypothetical protein